tara:strand:+ start:312 stop:521 length:210 start_codon:yes stop_codon:yes gene_type:complete
MIMQGTVQEPRKENAKKEGWKCQQPCFGPCLGEDMEEEETTDGDADEAIEAGQSHFGTAREAEEKGACQ